MSFPKAPTKRFNEIISCAPPPGVYDLQLKDRVSTAVFERTDRFKVPKDPGPGSYLSLSCKKARRRPTFHTSTPSSERKTNSLVNLENLPMDEQVKQFGSAPNLTDSLKEQQFQAEEIKNLKAKVQDLLQKISHDECIELEFNSKFKEMEDEIQKMKDKETDLSEQLREASEKVHQLECQIASDAENFQEKETELMTRLQSTQDNLTEAVTTISELKSSNLSLIDDLSKEKALLMEAENKNKETELHFEELQAVANADKDLLNADLHEKQNFLRNIENLETSLEKEKDRHTIVLKEKEMQIQELDLKVKQLELERKECLQKLLESDDVEKETQHTNFFTAILEKWLEKHTQELNILKDKIQEKNVTLSNTDAVICELVGITKELVSDVRNFETILNKSDQKCSILNNLLEKDATTTPLETLVKAQTQLLHIKSVMSQSINSCTNLATEIVCEKDKNTLLSSKVEKLQNTLVEKNELVAKLNTEIETLGIMIEDLKSSNEMLSMEVAQNSQIMHEEAVHHQEVKKLLSQKEMEVKEVFCQLQHENDEKMQLMCTNRALENKLTEGNEELLHLKSNYEQLLKKVQGIDQETQNITSHLEREEDKYYHQLSETKNVLTRLKDEVLTLRELEKNWKVKADEFQVMIDHLNKVNANLMKKQDSLVTSHNKKLMEVLKINEDDKKWMQSCLEELKLNLENQRDSFLCKVATLTEESEAMQASIVSENNTFIENVADLHQQLKSIETSFSTFEKEIQERRASNLSLQKHLEEKQDSLLAVKEDKEKLSINMKMLEEKLKSTESNVCSLNQEKRALLYEVQLLSKSVQDAIAEKEESFIILELHLLTIMEHFLTSLKGTESKDKSCFFQKLETMTPNFINIDSYKEKIWEAVLVYVGCQQEKQCNLKKIEEMQSQICSLENSLQQNGLKIAELQDEHNKKSSVIEILSLQKDNLVKEVESHLKTIDDFKLNVDALTSVVDLKEAVIDRLAADIELKENETKELNCKLHILENQVCDLTKCVEEKEKENNKSMNDLISQNKNLVNIMQDYSLQISNNDNHVQELKGELAKKEAHIDELHNQITTETKMKEELIVKQEALERKAELQKNVISNFEVEQETLLQKISLQDEKIQLLHQEQDKQKELLDNSKQELFVLTGAMKAAEEVKLDLQNQLCCLQQDNTQLLFLKKEYEKNCEARIKELQEDNIILQCDKEEERVAFDKRLMAEIKRNEQFEKEVAVAIKQLKEQMSKDKETFFESLQESTEMLTMLEIQHKTFSEEKEAELAELRMKFVSQDELYKEKINFVEELRNSFVLETQNSIEQLKEEAQRWKQLYQDLLTKIEPFKEQLDAYEIEHSLLLSQNTETEQDLVKLSDQYAQLLSHQNHRQKIRHVMKLKGDIMKMKKEIFRQKEVIAKQQVLIKKLEGESLEFDMRKSHVRRDKENIYPLQQVERRQTVTGRFHATDS